MLVETIVVTPVLLGVVILGLLLIEHTYVKHVTHLAAREAARCYAIGISQPGADPNAVLSQAQEVARRNTTIWLNIKPEYFNPSNDVTMERVNIGGTPYYVGTETIHVPVHAPWIRKALGKPKVGESQESWNQPIGRSSPVGYVRDISSIAVFRGEQ